MRKPHPRGQYGYNQAQPQSQRLSAHNAATSPDPPWIPLTPSHPLDHDPSPSKDKSPYNRCIYGAPPSLSDDGPAGICCPLRSTKPTSCPRCVCVSEITRTWACVGEITDAPSSPSMSECVWVVSRDLHSRLYMSPSSLCVCVNGPQRLKICFLMYFAFSH